MANLLFITPSALARSGRCSLERTKICGAVPKRSAASLRAAMERSEQAAIFAFAQVGARPPVLVLSNTGGGPLRQRQCGEQPHDVRPPDGGEQCVKGRYRMAATSP